MVSGILYIAKQQDDTIHYDNIVVRVMAADVLDMDNVGGMRIFLKTLIQGGVLKIAVDMTGLEFIDSSGIGILIEAAKMIRQSSGDIVLYAVPDHVQVIFQPVKLNRFIKIFETEDEVKNFFKHV